jgi:hypothetical protein
MYLLENLAKVNFIMFRSLNRPIIQYIGHLVQFFHNSTRASAMVPFRPSEYAA